MSQFFTSPTRPDTAAGAIAQYLRVKTTGALVVATATDVELGTMEIPATAAGPATVRLRNAPGTVKMIASGAITAGNSVYAAAGGKIAASGSIVLGTALESATANNDVIEVLRTADVAAPFVSQTLIAAAAPGAGNTILPGVAGVLVADQATNADDYIVLPALADTPNGFTITITSDAGGNFEVRTPADSDEEINSENCDGTKEYLFTNTQIHRFIKINDTIGWMAHGHTAIGTAVTAVVPD